MYKSLTQFLRTESSGGVLLIIAAILAMIIANSPFSDVYLGFLHTEIQVRVADIDINKSFSHWINDGLMAIFFLLIGLEVKQELVEGSLASRKKSLFPIIAAAGGMLAPALVYLSLNAANPDAIKGWAIPAATDIAFALGVLSLLGKRVPVNLKVFLLALAIMDDLGVIIIIALFYTADMSVLSLSLACACISILWLMHRYNIMSLTPYLIVGGLLWVAVLKSGVHATLAGVVIGFAIPMYRKDNKNDVENPHSPAKTLARWLHPWTKYYILPLFAFANAGVSLTNIQLSDMTSALPIGVALGLLIGKPLGIFSISWLAVKLKIATLPDGINFKQIFAVSVLCGIGFTMSMFITSLAFTDSVMADLARLGILMGSTLAAVLGYYLLACATTIKDKVEVEGELVDKG
ncbi:Na+/H+ antiporter NhaA [Moritella viscosa]|uniref:Na(+)/H(+) antiporter NhaA n=1 Tax=Moritella viscosa TaxID=80854 RepID=A0A1L0D7A3_9GAMM|nr:Na+/H+ antiporter NhaA [Moritella viscosa]SGY82091.1 Na(+)/H(+) antiporter nhaA 2-Sodium/proton antiporter nhaA 2 [Moritella viscosa]SGY82347.1 Na(+)/H(+) antiporter nhaA 2-Sodium/proton antiporter nhaA 2 [Moritella viscosa]SGY82512.1 Na(+)/H(+) antiporter nhaA 2-Sodium/proton antiporter nhaA 2 [Moritella viscosa]SGY82664.1 Na(+)/H(+) antiporter nhaA 2-Sodium/proton antiporter nhaA 2 [Moritella viscosa]SHN96524.1 Na(+)/H(+) antiporter nhaA 2-Sodium/proton antiporter nhaA 2 [Moritella viscos